VSDLPVRTDSSVKIMSLSPLGENHVELLPGNDQAPQAANGALLPSQKYIDFNSLTAQLTELNPQVEGLMHTLNDRATEVKVTIQRVNDLLSPQNRANLSATLADTRGLVEDVRPQMNTALHNVNTISDKVQPLIEDFRKTSAEADKALSGINSMVGENQSDVHQAVLELRRALSNMTQATAQLNQTLNANSDNIDEMLDNMRHVTENMKEFTSTIKTRPYTLIRASNPREHKTGEQQ
jgi:phospholipid/cholesterol/gamma-HCH transport system substrate-binding protein